MGRIKDNLLTLCVDNPRIIQEYYYWLGNIMIMDIDDDTGESYTILQKTLFDIPYTWFIFRDDDRLKDVYTLREEFCSEFGYYVPANNDYGFYVTTLEVLVAMDSRMSDITDEPRSKWFWMMLRNLGISGFSDSVFANIRIDKHVGNVIDVWLKRQFESDGTGSPFPLKHPKSDQRLTEIWVQMNNYLSENAFID